MATRPSTTATWATTTNYATSNDPSAVGQPTKNDPSSIAAQGWDYATRPDPTFLNHWMNRVGDWIGWVKDNAFGADGGIYTLEANLELRGAFDFRIANSCSLVVRPTGKFYQQGEGHLTSGSTTQVDNGAILTFENGATLKGLPVYDPDGGDFFYWLGPQVVEAPITIGAGGSIGWRTVSGADGDFNYGAIPVDEVFIGVLTGNCTYTLDAPPVGSGAVRMRFNAWGNSSAFTASIMTAEGLHTMRAASGHTGVLEVVYHSGAWHRSIVSLF